MGASRNECVWAVIIRKGDRIGMEVRRKKGVYEKYGSSF